MHYFIACIIQSKFKQKAKKKTMERIYKMSKGRNPTKLTSRDRIVLEKYFSDNSSFTEDASVLNRTNRGEPSIEHLTLY